MYWWWVYNVVWVVKFCVKNVYGGKEYICWVIKEVIMFKEVKVRFNWKWSELLIVL